MVDRMQAREGEYPIPSEIKSAFDKALRLREQYEHESARRVLLEILEMFPEEPRILHMIGTTYLDEEGREEEAEKYFLLTLRYAPDFGVTLANISGLYSRLGRFEKSAEYARRAIKVNNETGLPWMTLGLYYARKGNVETALDYFLAAYSRDEDYSLAIYNAACALVDLCRYEEAFEYLEKSLVLRRVLEHAKTDASLEPLRKCPEYDRIISEAEEKLNE